MHAEKNAFIDAPTVESVSVSTTEMCFQCHEDCETCIGGGDDQCASCAAGKVLDGRVCLLQCPDTKWQDGELCTPAGCEFGEYISDNEDGGDVVVPLQQLAAAQFQPGWIWSTGMA